MGKMWIAFIVLVSGIANAELLPSATEGLKTKKTMQDFLVTLTALKAYISSDAEFINQKNYASILKGLKELSTAAKNTKHDPKLLQENFKFSRQVLEDHLVETERVFGTGNKIYARWMMNSTLGICVSCHSQIPTNSRQKSPFLVSKVYSSDFYQADFLFATRDFEGASQIYRKLIKDYPKSGANFERLELSVGRELSYCLRIKRQLPVCRERIKDFLKNKELPESISKRLNGWDGQLAKWSEIELPNPKSTKEAEINKFAEVNLSSEAYQTAGSFAEKKVISYLLVSGILFEYLQSHPLGANEPDILYWLAKTDRELNNTFFYSLADLYLRECILKFPAHPTALKCYDEYKEEMILGYTGSSGVNIPADVSDDLKQLKGFIDSKGKTPLKLK